MLYSIEPLEKIETVPHENAYSRWRSCLSPEDIYAIESELESRIAGGEIHTSSWIPGSDWTGTVFEPIYTKACDYDPIAAGLCFGLFVWVQVQKHPEPWAFGRYEKDGVQLRGLTYFRIHLS